MSEKQKKSSENDSMRKQEKTDKDTLQFTDKERKAKDVYNKQTRGGFE